MNLAEVSAHGIARKQRGVSLFVVLIVLVLALILVLAGLTVANLNESLVGNQSDQQRAYAAAEALLNSAQRDITLNNGWQCQAKLGATGTHTTLTQQNGSAAACTARYPADMDDFVAMHNTLIGLDSCGAADSTLASIFKGVCISSAPVSASFMSSKVNVSGSAQQLDNGASYGEFTAGSTKLDDKNWGDGVKTGDTSLELNATKNFKGAYWVEVFPYNPSTAALGGGVPVGVPLPDSAYPFIFRITAMAQGLRGGTVSVLRTYYVPYPRAGSAAFGE
ncbi:MAG: hypothetical protein LBV44_06205 [Methylobacillus sp.]|nr:hypothetical protein [Methylobacillus sp.]